METQNFMYNIGQMNSHIYKKIPLQSFDYTVSKSEIWKVKFLDNIGRMNSQVYKIHRDIW